MSNYYSELAFAYVHDLLPCEQKDEVFRLIETEPAFREALRQELALVRKLQTLQYKAPDELRLRVRNVLVRNATKPDALQFVAVVLNPILQASLPEVIWLAIKRCQERVYFSG